MKNHSALDLRSIYSARAEGAVAESAADEPLPTLLKQLQAAMQAKDAPRIREAAESLGRSGSKEEGAAGWLFAAIGAAGMAAPDLPRLDELLIGMTSLIAALHSLPASGPSTPTPTPSNAVANAVRAQLRYR